MRVSSNVAREGRPHPRRRAWTPGQARCASANTAASLEWFGAPRRGGAAILSRYVTGDAPGFASSTSRALLPPPAAVACAFSSDGSY
ncbi:hypothetical protein MTO96_008534 [Rhipicephalus appendiculatus]